MRLRGVHVLCAAAASVSAVLVLAGPAAAANLHCGEEIVSSVTLIGNLDCTGTGAPALWIGADGVTLNLNGFAVTGAAGYDVIENYAEGSAGGHGTTAGTPANGTTIKNGTLNINGYAAAVDNVNGGSGLTVDVVSIVGDGTYGSAGVHSVNSSGLDVIDGSISDVTYGVLLYNETDDLIKNNTIAPSYGFGPTVLHGLGLDTVACAGVDEEHSTDNMVVGNAFSPFDPVNNPQTCWGLFSGQSAGAQFTGNTVTGMNMGVLALGDAGLAVTSNVMDGNVIGVELEAANSGDLIAGNYVKNSAHYGVFDGASFNNTYNGNILTSNGKVGSDPSYYIAAGGYGPVTMVNNYARLGWEAGFVIEGAFSSTVSGPPYSTIVGNNAIGNGSIGAPGFYSDDNVGSTWSKNTAYANGGDGFLFLSPWRQVITGNSAKLNGDDGFLFAAADANHQPLAVTGNSATFNGGYGFTGWDDEGEAPPAYPVSGSGNTGGGTNGIADCYLVGGCS